MNRAEIASRIRRALPDLSWHDAVCAAENAFPECLRILEPRSAVADEIARLHSMDSLRALGKFVRERRHEIIDALRRLPELSPMETCPRVPGVPYVLSVKGVPVVASWGTTGDPRDFWVLWLAGDTYESELRDAPEGWWPISERPEA